MPPRPCTVKSYARSRGVRLEYFNLCTPKKEMKKRKKKANGLVGKKKKNGNGVWVGYGKYLSFSRERAYIKIM